MKCWKVLLVYSDNLCNCNCQCLNDLWVRSYDLVLFLYWLQGYYRGFTGGFLLLQNFSVAISVSPHVCFILVLFFISMFLR